MNKSLLAVAAATFACAAAAEQQPAILQIYDQFVVTSAAAGQCLKPDPEELKKFLANFQTVTVHAGAQLESANPGRTREDLAGVMKQRGEEITARVNDLIKQRGCDDKEVKMVVERFHAQAQWEPGKMTTK